MNRKELLYLHCIEILSERVEHAENAMKASQHDSNSETKSSAGDKYETGRAMAQLDKERHARRHSVALDTLYQLKAVGAQEPTETVSLGSLVETNIGTYFITIGMGSIDLDGEQYHVISKDSPIGQQLLGMEEDDEFIFRSQEVIVLAIK